MKKHLFIFITYLWVLSGPKLAWSSPGKIISNHLSKGSTKVIDPLLNPTQQQELLHSIRDININDLLTETELEMMKKPSLEKLNLEIQQLRSADNPMDFITSIPLADFFQSDLYKTLFFARFEISNPNSLNNLLRTFVVRDILIFRSYENNQPWKVPEGNWKQFIKNVTNNPDYHGGPIQPEVALANHINAQESLQDSFYSYIFDLRVFSSRAFFRRFYMNPFLQLNEANRRILIRAIFTSEDHIDKKDTILEIWKYVKHYENEIKRDFFLRLNPNSEAFIEATRENDDLAKMVDEIKRTRNLFLSW